MSLTTDDFAADAPVVLRASGIPAFVQAVATDAYPTVPDRLAVMLDAYGKAERLRIEVLKAPVESLAGYIAGVITGVADGGDLSADFAERAYQATIAA